MLEQAERVKQRLPLLEIHADVLEACVRQGEGDLDNSAVIKEIRRRTRPDATLRQRIPFKREWMRIKPRTTQTNSQVEAP